MNVNYQIDRDMSFRGFYNNKAIKKGLEFAADNGTLFAATTTLALSAVRPLAILATPNTDKKNKQVACAKSITSSLNGYLIALACSYPLSKSIKRINKNPELYLKKDTINSLKEIGKTLTESKAYAMATQLFKLGLGLVIAAPKAVLTALGTPYILKMFNTESSNYKENSLNNVQPVFKGKNKFSSKIGEIIDNKNLQNFVEKNKDSNFPLYIIAGTDILSTGVFVQKIASSKKMDKKDKKPLICNSIISTALSIVSTYLIDAITKNQIDKFVEKYRKINKNDPNLAKQIEGIKIAKPILIAGIVYYLFIPIISTFLADRIKE